MHEGQANRYTEQGSGQAILTHREPSTKVCAAHRPSSTSGPPGSAAAPLAPSATTARGDRALPDGAGAPSLGLRVQPEFRIRRGAADDVWVVGNAGVILHYGR